MDFNKWLLDSANSPSNSTILDFLHMFMHGGGAELVRGGDDGVAAEVVLSPL